VEEPAFRPAFDGNQERALAPVAWDRVRIVRLPTNADSPLVSAPDQRAPDSFECIRESYRPIPSQLGRYVTPSRKSPCSAETPVRVPIPPASAKFAKSQAERGAESPAFESCARGRRCYAKRRSYARETRVSSAEYSSTTFCSSTHENGCGGVLVATNVRIRNSSKRGRARCSRRAMASRAS